MERKLIELAAEREAALNAAQAALDAQDEATYNSEMERVQNMNAEIARIQNLIAERNRQVLETTPSPAEARDMAAERGSQLMNHQSVRISNSTETAPPSPASWTWSRSWT